METLQQAEDMQVSEVQAWRWVPLARPLGLGERLNGVYVRGTFEGLQGGPFRVCIRGHFKVYKGAF